MEFAIVASGHKCEKNNQTFKFPKISTSHVECSPSFWFAAPPCLFCRGIDNCSGAVKLQKEREKPKKERKKEKNREKKEKPREDVGKPKDEKHSHKKRHYEEMSQLNQQGGHHTKTTGDEIEQLEKSGLTEEHGLPVVPNLCYSSDSTQNSAKRRKHGETDVSNNNHHGKGRGFRIRLPLQKHKDPEPTPSAEQPCFSGRAEATAVREAETDLAKSSFFECGSSSIAREAAQYRDLTVNWNPPPLQMELLPDSDNDLEWLFSSTRRSKERGAVKPDSSGVLGRGRDLCSWPPRACFLPEADIHALPFVVPF